MPVRVLDRERRDVRGLSVRDLVRSGMTRTKSSEPLDERVVDALNTLASGTDVTVYLAARLNRVSVDDLTEALLNKAEEMLAEDITPQAVASSLGVTHGFLTLELRRRKFAEEKEESER